MGGITAGVGFGEDILAVELDGGSVGACVAAVSGSASQPARNIRATKKMAALIKDLDDGGANLKLIGA